MSGFFLQQYTIRPESGIFCALQRILLNSILLLLAIPMGHCPGPDHQEVLDLHQTFQDLERELRASYVLDPEGSTSAVEANFGRNYLAALQFLDASHSLDPARKPPEQLGAALRALPVTKQRKATYQTLNRFTESLPLGQNFVLHKKIQSDLQTYRKSAGAGLILKRHAHQFIVVDVLEDSGSFRENLYPGLVLQKIDNHEFTSATLEEIVYAIRGLPGTHVRLEFKNLPAVEILRDQISLSSMQIARWDTPTGKKVLHLMPRSIDENTINHIDAHLKQSGTLQTLILDLRKLHQGSLHACIGLADAFRGPGPTLSLRSRNGEILKKLHFTAKQIYHGNIYVWTGPESSVCALLVARALNTLSTVTTMGVPLPIQAFQYSQAELSGGWTLNMASTLLYEGNVAYHTIIFKPDITMVAALPRNAPLRAPDPNDPLQVFLAKRLQIPTN